MNSQEFLRSKVQFIGGKVYLPEHYAKGIEFFKEEDYGYSDLTDSQFEEIILEECKNDPLTRMKLEQLRMNESFEEKFALPEKGSESQTDLKPGERSENEENSQIVNYEFNPTFDGISSSNLNKSFMMNYRRLSNLKEDQMKAQVGI